MGYDGSTESICGSTIRNKLATIHWLINWEKENQTDMDTNHKLLRQVIFYYVKALKG